jgi:Bacterial protein of unknown function (DUF882)
MEPSTNEGNNPAGLDGSTDEARRRPKRVGISPRGERLFQIGGIVVLVLFALAWSWTIADANSAARRGEPVPSPARTFTAAVRGESPAAAYVTDVALEALAKRSRGTSGRLRVKTVLPGEVDKALSAIANFAQITLTPFSAKQRGRIGEYMIGSWPGERGARGPARAPPGRYGNPRGFIQVTLENRDSPVSDHFKLRDFLTKNQPNVWPKYLVLELRLIDKLELVLADLQSRGIRTEGVTVMSGFRTPSYNVGGGNTGGRADLSRHMYGDAADVYIDNDRNGTMDDLNGDGRIDQRDAQFILESVDRVERAHPELIGGGGVYSACCGHGPFIHIDTRGYRARWTGSGGG